MEESVLRIVVDSSNAEKSTDNLDKKLNKVEKSGKKVDGQFKKLTKSAKENSKATEGSASAFKGLVVAATAFATVGLGAEILNTTASFESMKLQLKTLLGDMDKASGAFAALETFAARTPYALEQSVAAFQKLTALGLVPSEAALYSYGNTASAMGKDLTQLIEAVADASTGEFERLKEFGIKAKKQGEIISFTFQGVTTQIKNNSQEIQDYLIAIGQNQFAGAMDDQMSGLNGQLSNLSDSWNRLKYQMGKGLEGTTFIASFANTISGAREWVLKFFAAWKDAVAFTTYSFHTIDIQFEKLTLNLDYYWKKFAGGMAVVIGGAVSEVTSIFATALDGYAGLMEAIGDTSAAFYRQQAQNLRNSFPSGAELAELHTAELNAIEGKTSALDRQQEVAERSYNAQLKANKKLLKQQIEALESNARLDDYIDPNAGKVDHNARSEEDTKKYESGIEAIEKFIGSQRMLQMTIGQTDEAIQMITLSQDAQRLMSLAQTEAEREKIAALYEQANAQITTTQAAQKDLEQREQAAELIDELSDGQVEYNEAIEDYNILRKKGYITDQQYLKLLKKLKIEHAGLLSVTEQTMLGVDAAIQEYADSIESTFDLTKNITTKVFEGMEDALVDFVMAGKANFADLARSIIADIIRIQIKMAILNAMQVGGVGGGGGGIFGSIISGIGSFFGSIFGFAKGGAFNNGMIPAYAKGDSFTNGIEPFSDQGNSNSVVSEPTLFKFAKGIGLMGEAGPEAIMPLTRTSSGELGVRSVGGHDNAVSNEINNNIEINIAVDNSGETTAETSSSDGESIRELGMVISTKIKETLIDELRPGGLLNRG